MQLQENGRQMLRKMRAETERQALPWRRTMFDAVSGQVHGRLQRRFENVYGSSGKGARDTETQHARHDLVVADCISVDEHRYS